MNRRAAGKCVVAAVWMVVAAMAAAPARAVDDVSLVVAPGSDRVRPGDLVTVNVTVANLSAPINGLQVLLRYDRAVLNLIDVTPVSLGLAPPAAGWVEVFQSDSLGDVAYAVSVNGGSVSTNHTAAVMTFQAIAEGTTSVTFRPDAPPFITKLTVAADNSTVLPNKINSGNIVSLCDDGVFCNGPESFVGGLCQPGTPPCNDGVPCTVDTCTEATDTCTFTPTDANCSDGLFCNGAEFCHPVLNCRPGVVPCNDGVACTVDTCTESTDTCVQTPNDAFCSDGLFCTGAETCHPTLGCQASTNPCTPLVCDEPSDTCLSPIHIANLEVFYAGKFRMCHGGTNPGTTCTSSANCTGGGVCREQVDSSHRFMANASTATLSNVTNYQYGITGIRIFFDNIVNFATTPAAAFTFEWTTGSGTTFSAVSSVATAVTVSASVENGVSVVSIVLADNHVKRRWLRVTMDAAQITTAGVPLDGEIAGNPPPMPSGNGSPGGNAVFYLGNLTGDVDGDRSAKLTDVGLIRNCGCFNPFVRVPITTAHDVDKDGRVVLTDVGLARAEVNPFFTLPLLVR